LDRDETEKDGVRGEEEAEEKLMGGRGEEEEERGDDEQDEDGGVGKTRDTGSGAVGRSTPGWGGSMP
jgi:hypothetical protein